MCVAIERKPYVEVREEEEEEGGKRERGREERRVLRKVDAPFLFP
jgi:hypothetical protein